MPASGKKPTGPRAKHRYGAGLDVHKNYVTACVVMLCGAVVRKVALQEFKQTPKGLANLCQFLGKYLLEVVVMEATGIYTPPVKDALDAYAGWGMMKPAVVVINPSLVQKYPGETHEDKADALALARLGLLGLAEASFIPTGAARELRSLTREVAFLERDCTRAKNRAKRVLAAWGLPLEDLDLTAGWSLDLFRALDAAGGHFGQALDAVVGGSIKIPRTSKVAIARRAEAYGAFKTVQLPPTACAVLRGHLAALAFQEALIGKLSQDIETTANKDPAIQRAVVAAAAIAGISAESAAGIVAEVGDIRRFPTVRKFLQYAGCAPGIYRSGKTERRGHLNKRVNMVLKRHLYLAGKAICVNVKADSDLKEYARAQMNRHWVKKERKLAFMNTGIKLARVLYAVLKEGRVYDPIYESSKGATPAQSGSSPESMAAGSAPPVPGVVLRNVRRRARQFARYIHHSCAGTSAEWYRTLAKYFSLLEQNSDITP